jgi:hypothetical protein
MGEVVFEQVLKLAQQLLPVERIALAKHLLAKSESVEVVSLTRESVIAELERRRAAGLFEHVESLRNKYANPALDDLTNEQLLADIHEASTEWEAELDGFFRDDSQTD